MSNLHQYRTNHNAPKAELGFGLVPYILSLLVVWTVGAVLMGYFCCAKDSEQAAIPATATVPHISQSDRQSNGQSNMPQPEGGKNTSGFAKSFTVRFADNQGDTPSLSPSEGFNFTKSNFQFIAPVDAELNANLVKLSGFLSENASRKLFLTGRYSSDETNFSAFPNLGLARANQVKNHLVSLGFNPVQLSFAAALNDNFEANKQNVFANMVDFNVKMLSQDDIQQARQATNAFVVELKRKPMLLYFDEGEASILLNDEQRQKLLGMVAYLDAYPSAQLVVIGHTDNTGDAVNNVVLGQERAQYVANFLQTNGLPKSRLVVSSMGETQPIAGNATIEGRKLNRRVVVTLN